MYLDNISSTDTFLFYNCTYPWFGSFCEYRFDQPQSSFAEQVEKSIIIMKDCEPDFENLPCYTHLQCDRAGDHGQTPSVCLDWREICDGKMDCLDGGHDEEYCWQLEINECDRETEFRCHNGLCIPIAFLHDDLKNADCLDRTDEPHAIDIINKPAGAYEFLKKCSSNLSFRCEEHMCRPFQEIEFLLSQGDGLCGSPFFAADKRLLSIKRALISTANLSDSCRVAFQCLTMFTAADYNSDLYCDYDNRELYARIVKQDLAIARYYVIHFHMSSQSYNQKYRHLVHE
ncbi:unnamed protein product [Rotaria sp. Silwood2]|nr:unnamed protein product [Rotaria sp. Silwood2]CAF4199963.1 unnamed protein product [Rotaria sp. Silwood2]